MGIRVANPPVVSLPKDIELVLEQAGHDVIVMDKVTGMMLFRISYKGVRFYTGWAGNANIRATLDGKVAIDYDGA